MTIFHTLPSSEAYLLRYVKVTLLRYFSGITYGMLISPSEGMGRVRGGHDNRLWGGSVRSRFV